ncbi:MAG: hypothetical protein A3F31_02950 [Candidatus Levybacteria bacterium RIFCSPHIGHO2_12_FULL_38_12]|nr:MAG: hypothetical protein A2770_00510 [Candidatus Levybacteria bacterium RIFCSPHIGHO2_01_FULL_38_12]OGH22265.1 MAG: hypothetical protein A3D75_00275 [Candidatus Levybacteria bacterium RIFCSPHIGHO2_02_FULL_37_18]OGH22684.1 MAG: hypothetical protein A3F31_02950 [Candidatus Levybacteria bacterium RIFCSPHIGHO2_12_FULL_38_12]OGH33520.1 MAG: hypothetical protein A3A47_03260 [Candidatus Levybacteria bacterium RIFCSPLOWO2_01_FULL_37_20]OGH43382.1 MAG: hypothetical protein A3J14_04215 [Candidatus Lev
MKPIRQAQGKHFYSHIIELESLFVHIEDLEISDGEKNHLRLLADSTIHHTIIDAILSELNTEDKKNFLHILSCEDHNDIWRFLNTKVDSIEEKIKKVAQDLKKELHEDIKTAKK